MIEPPEEEGSIVLGQGLGSKVLPFILMDLWPASQGPEWFVAADSLPISMEDIEIVSVVRIGWGEEG